MPTPSRTGTAVQIDASGAGSGSGSHTIPADCNLVVAHWAHFDSNGGTTLATLTLNGVSFLPAKAEIEEGSITDASGHGVAILVNPATGSQTVAWAWSGGGARTEGGWIVLVFYKDANTGDPFRAADVDVQVSTNNCSVTISSDPTDIISAACQSFNANPSLDGSVFINDVTLNSERYDVSDVTPSGGASTTVNMTGEAYSSMSAISLKASADTGIVAAWLTA
jgi:hypothetical protein